MSQPPNSDLDFLLDDIPAGAAPAKPVLAPWRVLIVDDDESVHSISRVVLGDVRFQERGVEILSAYSAREAAALLRCTPDIAVLLLDVVMEADDAGLWLVREIRDEMRNARLRIILRTGQPGQAPEREVILTYDINDYKSKTELTAQKLFTATIAALRAYADIVALERSHDGLARIIAGAPDLFAQQGIDSYAATLLRQVAGLIGQEGDGVVVAPEEGEEGTQGPPIVLAASGAFIACQGRPYGNVLPEAVCKRIALALDEGVALNGEYQVARPLSTPGRHAAAVYFRAPMPLEADLPSILDIMCAMLGIGLDNVRLHGRLMRHQSHLEALVEARTADLAAINADLVAAQNSVNEELRAARTLQQSILPAGFPRHERYEGHALMRAARMIGGDFYDIFHLDDDRVGIVVADVSGKGVPAALFMVQARSVLQDVALRDLSPAASLAEANVRLIERNPLSMFVTAIYGILDARSGEFTFCNGGHLMPYVLRAGAEVAPVPGRPAPLLGLIEGASYAETTLVLGPGDALLLISDGVTECFDQAGVSFGEERLMACLAGARHLPAERLLGEVMTSLERFSNGCPASDDVTVLVLRFTGGLDGEAVEATAAMAPAAPPGRHRRRVPGRNG